MIYHNFAIMIWFLAAKVAVDILILSHSKALLRLLRRCGGVMGGPSPGAVSWKLIWCPKMMYYYNVYIYIFRPGDFTPCHHFQWLIKICVYINVHVTRFIHGCFFFDVPIWIYCSNLQWMMVFWKILQRQWLPTTSRCILFKTWSPLSQ